MKFDLKLLQHALSPLPYVVVGDDLFLLAGIEHATANEDGSLLLDFGSSKQITLQPSDVKDLAGQLNRAILGAQNLIQVPKIAH